MMTNIQFLSLNNNLTNKHPGHIIRREVKKGDLEFFCELTRKNFYKFLSENIMKLENQ